MIKILFLIPTLSHGGAERVLTNLVNHMDKEKFEITVQTMFDVGIYKDKLDKKIKYIGGLKYYFPGNTKVFKLFSPKQLYKYYIKDKYDIIVSYLEGPSARVVCGCPDNTKLISWIHSDFQDTKYAYCVFRNKTEAEKCYERFDLTACVSNQVKDNFCRLFSNTDNVRVYYNTVESDVIIAKSAEPVDSLVLSEDEINLVSTGKLQYTKSYDRLISICKRLIDDGLPVHLYLIGDGEDRPKLLKLASELGIKDKVTFAGFKTNPYKYVRACDLFVCSSIREGFSTAVTESLIVGTPVVSTNCSGATELLGDNNEYGIVTDNNEEALYQGVKEMLSNNNLTYYKERAVERGKQFNTESTVKEVEKMLQEVINK